MKIYFTREEIEELLWIVPQFKDTHEEHYIVAEKEKVESIIVKLKRAKSGVHGNTKYPICKCGHHFTYHHNYRNSTCKHACYICDCKEYKKVETLED